MSIIEKALGKQRESSDQNTADRESHDAAASLRARSESEPLARTASQPPRSDRVAVDLHHLRQCGVWPPAPMEQHLRDQYRRIKRPLIANARERGAEAVEAGNLLVVTSSLAGEGKTFTSINLALSVCQEPDFEVLLVDGDTARRSASVLLGVQEHRGLVDLLADRSLTVDDVTLPTNIQSLSLLPAGRSHALSTELLSSERMQAIVRQLAEPGMNRIVIFDSPPLLSSPEAVTIAGLVGQIVVVVKAGETQQHEVIAALDQLDPGKPINMVLNQTKQSHGSDYYGGYYGYEGNQ